MQIYTLFVLRLLLPTFAEQIIRFVRNEFHQTFVQLNVPFNVKLNPFISRLEDN